MKPPCELVVWYVLPAIRSELAKSLLSLGMKQKDVSELMDITQPAVSQYITDKRGSGIKFNDEVNSLINDFASELYSGEAKKSDIISKTCFDVSFSSFFIAFRISRLSCSTSNHIYTFPCNIFLLQMISSLSFHQQNICITKYT